jgi:hypothetical protein
MWSEKYECNLRDMIRIVKERWIDIER